MSDRSKEIFGNKMPQSVYNKAVSSKKGYANKFGDDTGASYPASVVSNPYIGDLLGVSNIALGQSGEEPAGEEFDTEKGIIVGNTVWASVITAFQWR